MDKRTFFFFKKPETGFDNFLFFHNFGTKRAIFLGKYFKNSVKDCEFPSDILNINIWVCRLKQNIFNFAKNYQKKIKKKRIKKVPYFLSGQPRTPHPPIGQSTKKRNFFEASLNIWFLKCFFIVRLQIEKKSYNFWMTPAGTPLMLYPFRILQKIGINLCKWRVRMSPSMEHVICFKYNYIIIII